MVEFIGMPGVGKSTIAEALGALRLPGEAPVNRRALEIGRASRPVRILHKSTLLLWLLRRDITGARAVGRLAGDIVSSAGRPPVKVLVNWLFLIALLRRNVEADGLVILDQGIAQGLWSTLYRASAGDWNRDGAVALFEEVLRQTEPRSLIVVLVKAEENVLWRRIASRRGGGSPLDARLRCGAFDHALMVTREVEAVLSQVVERCPIVRVIECWNSDRLGDAVAALESSLSASHPPGLNWSAAPVHPDT